MKCIAPLAASFEVDNPFSFFRVFVFQLQL